MTLAALLALKAEAVRERHIRAMRAERWRRSLLRALSQHPDAGPDGELGEDGSSRTSPSSPSGDPKGGA